MTTVAALSNFVAAYRDLQTPRAVSPQRIATFIESWRRLVAQAPPQLERAPLRATDDLRLIIHRLSTAFMRARSTGAFANVWEVAGLGRDERRNAAALAWLLDPRGTHGMGTAMLAAFLQATKQQAPTNLETAFLRVEHRPMNSERDRVDIVIDHQDLLLLVEVKIDAALGACQLERYLEAAAETARCTGRTGYHVVFLTVRHTPGTPDQIVPLLWANLAMALEKALVTTPAHSFVLHPVQQLLKHYRRLQETS